GTPLAGSTDSLIVLPTGLAPGKHVITWDISKFDTIGGEPWAVPSASEKVEFLVLGVEASIDQNKLFTGQGTTLRLKITGTDEAIPIEFENKTPEIIEMEGGTKQVINTTGGGENSVERGVKGLKRGKFDIKYKLTLPPCPCSPQETQKTLADEEERWKREGMGGTTSLVAPTDEQLETIADTESKECGIIRTECEKLETRVKQIIDRRQKELRECDELSGSAKENCIARVHKIYDSFIREEQAKRDKCFERLRECGERERNIKPPVSSVPDAPETTKKKTECDKLRKECAEFQKIRDNLVSALKQKQLQCEKFGKDKAGIENCKQILKSYYDPLIKKAQDNLDDCRRRLASCSDELRKQAENPPTPKEKKEDWDVLARTCRDLELNWKTLENDLIRDLRECQTQNPNDAKAEDACRERITRSQKPRLDEVKKMLDECRARLAKCKKEDE
ncbi:MAG: hypothetical protein KDB79_07520, partial [Acidobacteria bacterium]|nr:hypothetical protein [Acidobacteriota bacterium]